MKTKEEHLKNLYQLRNKYILLVLFKPFFILFRIHNYGLCTRIHRIYGFDIDLNEVLPIFTKENARTYSKHFINQGYWWKPYNYYDRLRFIIWMIKKVEEVKEVDYKSTALELKERPKYLSLDIQIQLIRQIKYAIINNTYNSSGLCEVASTILVKYLQEENKLNLIPLAKNYHTLHHLLTLFTRKNAELCCYGETTPVYWWEPIDGLEFISYRVYMCEWMIDTLEKIQKLPFKYHADAKIC